MSRAGSALLTTVLCVAAAVGLVLIGSLAADAVTAGATTVAPTPLPAPARATATVPPGHPMIRVPGPGETVLVQRRGQPMGKVDIAGAEHRIACMTCHTGRTPNPKNAASADLDLFHQGLVMQHGGNTCLSCHNGNDYGSLKLASGEAVAFDQSVRLCGQCHGPQYKDFTKGAHGGMNGYWESAKGGQIRQTCTACHDPHKPAYPVLQPMPHARDRFQSSAAHGEAHP